MVQSKTFIVTGGSRGIGLATVQFLLAAPEGHEVVVVARDESRLKKLKEGFSGRVQILAGDLSDLSVGKRAVEIAIQNFGKIDGLILNHAVITPVSKVGDTSGEDWRKSFDINVFGSISVITTALPELRKSNGRIIFITSGSASKPYQAWGIYGASKAALNHLASTLALEESDVTTLSIIPGMVDTDMSTELRENHLTPMDKKDTSFFLDLHHKGEFLKPSLPGTAIAKAALQVPHSLSGRVLSWDDSELSTLAD